jgi:rod shape-determining protein MreD
VKATSVLLTVAIAVTLQLMLARYTVGGTWLFDLVLVGVVYAALTWGPVAGMLAGTCGGLIQDVLSNDIVGTGGLAKTIIGFTTGALGAQFVVVRPAPRLLLFAGASFLHRLTILGLHALVDQHWPGMPWAAMLGETGLNSVCGLVAFRASDGWPGLWNKGREARRSGLKRREW